jgi:ribonuclease HII
MLKLRHTEDNIIEVGIDEAGRGCFWGPLYAGAVVWKSDLTDEELEITNQIKDSKKLSPKRRTALAKGIKEIAISWSIGVVHPNEIDTLGMTKSNQLAFVRALEGLQVKPERLLIDGILSIFDAPWSLQEQVVEVEADNHYVAVAAASILAKTEHDEWVKQFCDLNENVAETYGLLSNKGYGTAKHRAAIVQHGVHSLHRQTFLRKLFAGKPTADAKELEEE